MIKGKNVICISSIDWDFIWQGHQEIMSVLSENGNRVLFIENTGVRSPTVKDAQRIWKRFLNWKKGYRGIRKLSDTLYVYSPLVLPFPYSKIAVRLNKFIMLSIIKRWAKVMDFHDPVLWSFLPTPLTLNMMDGLEPSIFVYYCIDDFVSSSKGAQRIKKTEEQVIKRADLVFTTSRNLYKRARALNERTHLFPFGINIANYNAAREKPLDMPLQLAGIKRPIIGYVGGVHKWINMGLLKKIALAKKDASIVMVGPKQADLQGLDDLDNVYFLGQKESRDLPSFVKFFDVGLIPYRITPYTENVYPTKINEYLAMGKPVVSTEIPEVVEFDRENGEGFIHFITDGGDISASMDRALQNQGADVRQRRIDVANENSWNIKIEKMCSLIDERLGQIQVEMGRSWSERLRSFYAKTRKRTIIIVGGALLSYFALFYTPLIWFLASPLKIAQKGERADAIVVFGGGVGEMGSPGKSTIERARYSVDLLREGFSDRIIFSSGYAYNYNDAENMKLLALSMGIPEENIILEEKANSAYENVMYSSEIAKENGFDKIIVVSSPYNMRRVSLVFRHIAKDMDVVYMPVPDSQFYRREPRVRLEQIKAILHEYLGIAYYLVKGYI